MIIIKCLHALYTMGKLFNSVIVLFITCAVLSPIFQVQSKQEWKFDSDSPFGIVSQLKEEANKEDAIQKTKLNGVTSKFSECDWIAPDSRFTLTRTLCSIKANIKDYLQYVMYIWLTAATILLIRNGFKIVTSGDQGKEIEKFKKNLLYIVIWVFLLIWFYYVIDIFVSVVNLIVE